MYVNTAALHNGTSFVESLFEEFGTYSQLIACMETPPHHTGQAVELL